MKRPDYGNATPEDLARALLRPRNGRAHTAQSFVGGDAQSDDRAPGQRVVSGPPQPSHNHSRTEGDGR